MKINEIAITYNVSSFKKLTHCSALVGNRRLSKHLPEGILLESARLKWVFFPCAV